MAKAGISDAIDQMSLNAERNANTQRLLQALVHSKWELDEEKKSVARDEETISGAAKNFKDYLKDQIPDPPKEDGPKPPPIGPPGGMSMMPPGPPPGPPPQPMAPGQPSVPMMPPGAPPGGPQMAPPAGAMPPPMAAAPPGAGMPPKPPMPAPVPWKTAPSVAGVGAPPGGQPGIAAPPGQDPAMMQKGVELLQKKTLDPMEMFKGFLKQGAEPEAALRQVLKLKPLIDEHNNARFEELKIQTRAEIAAGRERERVLEAGMRDAAAAAKRAQSQPLVDAKVRSLDRGKGGKAGTGVGAPAAAGDDVDYSKMSVTDPKYNDTKALDQEGRRIQAWKYIINGVLPYRKGTGGAKDPNVGIMREVSRIARDNNMTPEEIVNMPGEWKANAQSLAFQTKKVDAIESVLSSFHNNIETWDRAAKGLPPNLGAGALEKGLGKINFSDVKSINDLKLKLQGEFNDPAVVAYLTAAMAVRMDYARIMQGPQSIASLSEGMKEDAKGIIPNGLSDAARAALIKTLDADTAGQLKGSKDQLKKIMARQQKLGHKEKDDDEPAKAADETPPPKASRVPGKTTWRGYTWQDDGWH